MGFDAAQASGLGGFAVVVDQVVVAASVRAAYTQEFAAPGGMEEAASHREGGGAP